jgi:glycosyltransferase involved in cell wall biosynthesis
VRVSVLIATYGTEDWRELAWSRAYPSAAAQTEDVQCFHDPEGTIASVRNELAGSAKGDWLLYLDADDEIAPGYLDAMAQVGGENVLLTPSVRKVTKGRPSRNADFYPEVPLENGNWLVVGTLVRREMFNRAGGFEDYPHGFEDWSLWYKCHRLGARVVRVPRAVYIQHVNPQSKHRQGWRNRRWQVETHQRVERELAAWTP